MLTNFRLAGTHLSQRQVFVVLADGVVDLPVVLPRLAGPMRTTSPVPGQVDPAAAEGGMDLSPGHDGVAGGLGPSRVRLQDQTPPPQLPPWIPTVREGIVGTLFEGSSSPGIRSDKLLSTCVPVVKRLGVVEPRKLAEREQINFFNGCRAELPYLREIAG